MRYCFWCSLNKLDVYRYKLVLSFYNYRTDGVDAWLLLFGKKQIDGGFIFSMYM